MAEMVRCVLCGGVMVNSDFLAAHYEVYHGA